MATSILQSEQFTFGVRESYRWAEICIIYQSAISRSLVAWTAASIVFCIGQFRRLLTDRTTV